MKIFFTLAAKIQWVVTAILLTAAYIIGIGIVSVIGKLFRVTFLPILPEGTSWLPFRTSENERLMY